MERSGLRPLDSARDARTALVAGPDRSGMFDSERGSEGVRWLGALPQSGFKGVVRPAHRV